MTNKFIDFFKTLNEKQVFLLLIGIAFGLRLYAVLMAQGIAFDSAGYGFWARDFLKGHFIKGLSSPAPPLYPFLISLFSPDTAHVEIAGRLLSLFFGTFAIIPLFYLIKGAVGQREAIFSALFYSFHPYLVTYSGMLLTEATYWGLLVLSVYFFWTGLKKEKVWRMASSGCFLGLAYLTRPEGIGYVLVYLIWIIVDGILEKKWFKKLILMGVLILSVLVFVIPYVFHIHQETGQWLISKKALTEQSQFLKNGVDKGDSLKDIEQNKPAEKDSKIQMIVGNIVKYIPHVTYHYLRAYHFSLWLFLFFGLIRVRRRVIAYELFLASLVLFHLFSLSTFIPSTIRFSIPVIPLSLFWVGTGVLEMRRHLGKIRMLNPEKVMSVVIIFVILVQLPQSLIPERRSRADQKKVGLWLKQNSPEDAIIMSNSPIEAFYADREFMLLPSGISTPGSPGKSYNEIIDYARKEGVRYILVNRNTHEMNPGFVESIRSKDLREVFVRGDRTSMIYEVIYSSHPSPLLDGERKK
jgi:4-amino-4-deoxy-L-arabinose transferase-like glycosyltransferase